jgi:hypothetical protein
MCESSDIRQYYIGAVRHIFMSSPVSFTNGLGFTRSPSFILTGYVVQPPHV